jgi:uncharacterized membrane protein
LPEKTVSQGRSNPYQRVSKRFFARSRSDRVAILILAFLILCYIVFFSAYQIQRHHAFETNLDTLSVEQPLWNTLHGQFMRTTYYPITGTPVTNFNDRKTDNLLGDHVQLGLLSLLIPYAIIPRTGTLMVTLCIAVGLGAIPMYRIAKRRLASPWLALLFAAGYLLLPAIETNTSWDIHGANFLPPLLLAALDAAESGRVKLWWVLAILAMSFREDFPIFVGWAMLWMAPRDLRRQARVMFGIGLIYSLVSFLVIIPYFGGGGTPYLVRFFPMGTAMTPQGIWSAVSQVSFWKNNFFKVIFYNVKLGFPLLFLYLASGPSLLAVLPMVLANGLSWYSYNLSPEIFHYSAILIPWVLVGTVDGLKNVTSYLSRRRARLNWIGVAGVALGTSIVTAHILLGYTPLSRVFVWPEVTARANVALAMIDQIPNNAPVSVDLHLAGHFSQFETVRVFPDIREAQWIMLDVWTGSYALYINSKATQDLWNTIMVDPSWETVSARDGFILLKKGSGPPKGIPDAYRMTTVDSPAMDIQFGDANQVALVNVSRITPSRSETIICTDWDLHEAQSGTAPELQFNSQMDTLTEAPGSQFRLSLTIFNGTGRYRICSRQDTDYYDEQRSLVISMKTTDAKDYPASIIEAGNWASYLSINKDELEVDLSGLR